jgi:hypothetical protein
MDGAMAERAGGGIDIEVLGEEGAAIRRGGGGAREEDDGGGGGT